MLFSVRSLYFITVAFNKHTHLKCYKLKLLMTLKIQDGVMPAVICHFFSDKNTFLSAGYEAYIRVTN